MRSRRFRLGLLLAVLVGLGSCEINPQPPLPGRDDHSPSTPGIGGSLSLGEGTGGATTGPSAGGTDNANGGSLVIDVGGSDSQIPGASDAGAGGAGAPDSNGGAGGADDSGGAAGAVGVPLPK